MEPELRRPTDSEFVCKTNNLKCAFTALLGHLHSPAKPKLSLPYFKASGINREFSKKQFKAGVWLRGKPQLAELSSMNTSCLSTPLQTKPKMLRLKRKISVAVDPSPVQTHPPRDATRKSLHLTTKSQFYFYTSPSYQIRSREHSIHQKAAQLHTVGQACASSVYHKGKTSRR